MSDASVRRAFARFDGKDLGPLELVLDRPTNDWIDLAIETLRSDDGTREVAASWLIRERLRRGDRLEPETCAAYVSAFSRLTHWESVLHACQSVADLRIPTASAAPLARFLEGLDAHEKPFVRAWSTDAWFRLATQHARYAERAEARIAVAAADPAASVRARVRAIRREAARPSERSRRPRGRAPG